MEEKQHEYFLVGWMAAGLGERIAGATGSQSEACVLGMSGLVNRSNQRKETNG